jgi:hypothetical protein
LYPDQQFQVFSHAQGLSSFPLRLQPLREVLDCPY